MSFYTKQHIQDALRVHTMVGLVCGWVLYLIFLSGTLAVLAEWIERLEQPDIPEFLSITPSAPQNAIAQLQDELGYSPDSIYVILPNEILPRMHISADDREWWLTTEGDLHDKVADGLANFIRELHTHLLLPEIFGTILVSCFAVMMLLLIFSGIWSHPSIIKDAFKWRRDGDRLQQVDLHNRLSVWGLPFHIMFGLTGAMFGLMNILVMIATPLYYDGDYEALINEIYGHSPTINNAAPTFDISSGLNQLKVIAPDVTPVYIVAQNAGKKNAFYEIAATVPGRFSYSEIYHFSASGDYLGNQQLTQGPTARQWIYSIYRVHFGHFGSWFTRIIYLLLGIALCIICTSGMKSYFLRTEADQSILFIWNGFVWGPVLSFAIAGIAVFFDISATIGFFSGLILSLLSSLIFIKYKYNITS